MVSNGSLDIEDKDQLVSYLQSQQLIQTDEHVEIELLVGGVSNKTMLVTRQNRTQWVIKQALEKLRVNVDWFSDSIRIHREAAGLRWLEHTLPEGHIPSPIFDDHENHIIGMLAIPQPHENWKERLLQGKVEQTLVKQFAQILAQIHSSPIEDKSLKTLLQDRTFFESLRVEPYYLFSAEQAPQANQFIQTLVSKTRARQLTVVHGDYSPKNVLIYQNKLVILDYEVIHIGDPAFDLGFSLTHFLSKAHHVQHQRQAFLDAALIYWQTYINTYQDIKDDELELLVIQHTLACLLARVVGRSVLEYLDSTERKRQKQIILELMNTHILSVTHLIELFSKQLEK